MPTSFVQQNVDGLIWRIDTHNGIAAAVVWPLVDVPLVWNGTDEETIPGITTTMGPVDMTRMDYLIVAIQGSPIAPQLFPYGSLADIDTTFTGAYQVLAIVGKTGPRDWEQG